MSKGIYIGNSNSARKVTDIRVGVSGSARTVTKGYIGVNGVAKQFFPAFKYTWARYNCDKTLKYITEGTSQTGNIVDLIDPYKEGEYGDYVYNRSSLYVAYSHDYEITDDGKIKLLNRTEDSLYYSYLNSLWDPNVSRENLEEFNKTVLFYTHGNSKKAPPETVDVVYSAHMNETTETTYTAQYKFNSNPVGPENRWWRIIGFFREWSPSITRGTFIDYVYSNEKDYPDNGASGNYWYVLQ